MTVSVPQPFGRFVKEQVATGKYASGSEVVRAGLQLLSDPEDERAQRRDAVKRFVQEGIADLESGKVFEAKTVVARMRRIIDEAENAAVADVDQQAHVDRIKWRPKWPPFCEGDPL